MFVSMPCTRKFMHDMEYESILYCVSTSPLRLRVSLKIVRTIRVVHGVGRDACVAFMSPNAQYGNNALLRAAIYGHANCVQVLVESGAHKEARNQVRIPRV